MNELEKYLTGLGSDADAIAGWFKAQGIRGLRNDCGNCPLARGVLENIEVAQRVQVDYNYCAYVDSIGNSVSCEMPVACTVFSVSFDCGCYPELDDVRRRTGWALYVVALILACYFGNIAWSLLIVLSSAVGYFVYGLVGEFMASSRQWHAQLNDIAVIKALDGLAAEFAATNVPSELVRISDEYGELYKQLTYAVPRADQRLPDEWMPGEYLCSAK